MPAAGALAGRAATPFKASLQAVPDRVLVGDKLYLNGSASPHKAHLVDFRWDLGNGKFSVDTKDIPWTSTSFSSPGVKTVRVKITNGAGKTAIATAEVRVRVPKNGHAVVSPAG